TPQSVTRIVRDDLTSQHAKLLARDVLKVVIVGDIDKAAAQAALDEIFGGLPERGQVALLAKADPRPLTAPIVVQNDLPSTTATFGLPSLASKDADCPALIGRHHIL